MIRNLNFTIDESLNNQKKIGLIVLASDYTIDEEFRKLFPIANLDYYQARIENSPIITPETLSEMKLKISSTLKLILPGDKLDIVGYGCTSATVVLGEEEIFSSIKSVHPNAKCTTPISAALKAFEIFDVKNIAVITPYTENVNIYISEYIKKSGYNISAFGSFNEKRDPVVASIDSNSIVNGVKETIKDKKIDMVFISCTSIKFIDFVPQLEKLIGIPVTTSNHAMAWHCMRLGGVKNTLPNLGQLFLK